MPFLSAIVGFSLRNRPLVLAAACVLVVFGLRAAVSLPIDAVPDVTNIQVQVITSAPALSPVEIEQYVTVPVERAMAGIPSVTRVRSISKYGLSVVTIDFTDDTNIYFARQLVTERMSEAREAVPSKYGSPEMGPISTALGEIFQFVVRNDSMSIMQLEELLDWYIAPALRTTPGVVEVNSFGGEDKQYQVVLDPKRLQAAGVSVAEVVAALERANATAGGGYLEQDGEHFVIGTEGQIGSLDDLREVVIGATPQGVPVTISTVGDARFGPRLRHGAASKDGEGEVVVGVALMLMGENSRKVTEAVKQKIRELMPSLPEGTRIEPFYDRAALVDRTIHTVGPEPDRGRAAGGARALSPAGRDSWRDRGRHRHPALDVVHAHRHERPARVRKPDEPRRDRLRSHRRRRRDHRRECDPTDERGERERTRAAHRHRAHGLGEAGHARGAGTGDLRRRRSSRSSTYRSSRSPASRGSCSGPWRPRCCSPSPDPSRSR